MPAGDYSKTPIGTKVFVTLPGDKGGEREIYGLTNVQIQSSNNPTQTTALLNGRSVQHTGAASPETLTGNLLPTFGTDFYNALRDSKHNGTSLPFRIQTGPTEIVGQGLVAADTLTISATDDATFGEVSFTTDKTPDDVANNEIAVGDVIRVGTAQYIIIQITDGNKVFVRDVGNLDTVTAVGTATAYNVQRPQATVRANATVTQIGNFTADAGGNAVTDSFELAFRNPLPDWTLMTNAVPA